MPMLLAAFLPLIAQASLPQTAEAAKLATCLELAASDPATAVLTASTWLRESSGAEQAFAHQCLGNAYATMLNWEAAERAFLTARNTALAIDHRYRARLAAMAGNAALASGNEEAALADFGLALGDADAAGDAGLAGEIQIDRARALVALGQVDEADAALDVARSNAPQNAEGWLLSATLARRMERFDTALSQIATAAALDPFNPLVALEAGLIYALSGNDEAAVKSWRSAIELDPRSLEAELARAYLAQIEGTGE